MQDKNIYLKKKICLPHLIFYPVVDKSDRVLKEKVNKYLELLNTSSPKDKIEEAIIYVHVPFCSKNCLFCTFNKKPLLNEEEYLLYSSALQREIEFYSDFPYIQNLRVTGLYFGGGTPTSLPLKIWEEIINVICKRFRLSENFSINTEGFIEDFLIKDIFSFVKNQGIGRISFGIQTFNHKLRNFLKLEPKFLDLNSVHRIINLYSEKDINVFFDIMYGLPFQSLGMAKEDVKNSLLLEPQGLDYIQLYPYFSELNLLLEKRENLSFMKNQDLINLISFAIDYFEKKGYIQKSIYTFAKEGFDNMIDQAYYGNNEKILPIKNCIGLGPSAIGMLGKFLYRNKWFNQYIKNRDSKTLFFVHLAEEKSIYDREFYLFPKKLKLIKKYVAESILEENKKKIEILKKESLINEDKDTINLTKKGRIYIDNIIYFLLDRTSKEKVNNNIWELPE